MEPLIELGPSFRTTVETADHAVALEKLRTTRTRMVLNVTTVTTVSGGF
jgi:hypothetical protein